MENIILIGMPGSGKTTLGREIAQKINYNFIDIDEIITDITKKSLKETLEQRGNKGFSRLENYILKKLHTTKTVISTGGSSIYHEEGMQNLSNLGTIIYLKVTLAEIKDRLGDYSSRGIVFDQGETIEQLYKKRNGLYIEYAQHIMEGDRITSEEVIHLARPQIGRNDNE